MKEGAYHDLSNEEYHADKESISRSALMDFDKSPYTYWANHINSNRPKKESTPQMIFGSAFHSLILEPKIFNENYRIMPEKVLLKDIGKEEYKKYKEEVFQLELSRKIILNKVDFDKLCDMEAKLYLNKQALELIKNARIENSFFWKDKESGLILKARPDILHDNIIVDLKTCANASPPAFQRAMLDGGYHIQGAMIRDAVEAVEGRRINNVINICIETKFPYSTAIYIIDEAALDAGEEKYKSLCLDLKTCLDKNEWPDYQTQTIGLPKWAT